MSGYLFQMPGGRADQHETLMKPLRPSEMVAAVERAMGEKQSRIEVLRQLNEEGEGLAQGSQALLKGGEFADAFGGPLAAQLDVEPEYVRAIEVALGRNLQALLLTKPELASTIVQHVTARELGQAALLLPQDGDTPQNGPLPHGAICWAEDKLAAAEAVHPLMTRLLHGIAIFENIDAALEASTRSAHSRATDDTAPRRRFGLSFESRPPPLPA